MALFSEYKALITFLIKINSILFSFRDYLCNSWTIFLKHYQFFGYFEFFVVNKIILNKWSNMVYFLPQLYKMYTIYKSVYLLSSAAK